MANVFRFQRFNFFLFSTNAGFSIMAILVNQNLNTVTSPHLSIIVISYNTKKLTIKCLESVFVETLQTSFEVIVVDNASSDGSSKAIEDLFLDKVTLISSSKNLGFAAANNLAAGKANGKFILLLNPDTEIIDNAIDALIEFSSLHKTAKIWGGKTLFADGTINPTSCWRKMSLWSLLSQAFGLSSIFRNSSIFNPERIGHWNSDSTKYVDIVSGCFFMIEKEFWIQLNGFDKDFFMYGEEADLCLRASVLEAKPMVTSKATIIHHGGASETIRADKLVRLIDAKMKLIQKHFPVHSEKIGLFLLSMWPFSRYQMHRLLAFFERPSSKKSVLVWKDVWDRKPSWKK
jgi:GT2 family glycosyltransferase